MPAPPCAREIAISRRIERERLARAISAFNKAEALIALCRDFGLPPRAYRPPSCRLYSAEVDDKATLYDGPAPLCRP